MPAKSGTLRPKKSSLHPDRDNKRKRATHGKRRPSAPTPRYGEHPIGVFVRQRRRAEHLSQRSLAELAGVAPRVVWELEHGKSTMRMDVVTSVLRVFGKTLGVVDSPRPEVNE